MQRTVLLNCNFVPGSFVPSLVKAQPVVMEIFETIVDNPRRRTNDEHLKITKARINYFALS